MRADARGAAMVEFVLILVPLMTLFLCVLELSRLSIAHLLLERAAGMAVRACAVVKDQPKNCEDAGPDAGETSGADAADASAADQLIRLAASEGLRPWTETNILVDSVDCTTRKPTGEDTVQIEAQFRCVVPIARDILCATRRDRLAGSTATLSARTISARARYAHQGASYDCRYANMEYAVPGASGPLDLPDLGGAWP